VSAGSGITLGISADGRADLQIRVPPVNVLAVADLDRIAELVKGVAAARVLVLTGLPRAFSAGVSIPEHEPEPESIARMLAAMRRALTALVECAPVTLAAVSGACLGGGAEIAAACDLVLVAADARIGFPEIKLACFPPGGAILLPRRIGEARANDWILTGRTVSGREAAEVGFASRAVESADLSRETRRLSEQILSRSPGALAAARDVLRAGRREALSSALPRAEEAYRGLAGSPDLRRAVREFSQATARPR
jgi:cyclohexa-1,5-dienecarbonyl-CoA hydratase